MARSFLEPGKAIATVSKAVSASLATSDRNPIRGADNPGAHAPGFFAGWAELQAPQIQLSGEFRARKCKENQGKFLWISLDSFGRIGTFQWVMTNPNKKNRRTLNSPPGLCSLKIPDALSVPASLACGPRHIPPEGIDITYFYLLE
jgi:hypothetical protein